MALPPRTRREFLADVARGAVLASLGPGLAAELGARLAAADDAPPRLTFGALEPLVALLQETPLDRLLPALVERLRTGTDLKTLVAAGALANARTFGGEDYVGFHVAMALMPAWRMAEASPEPLRALPVLKVLYRNGERIAAVGGRDAEVLRASPAVDDPAASGAVLRDAVRARDLARAERAFASLSARSLALDPLMIAVEDDAEVHRVVFPFRAAELLEVTGREHAHTLLRQSLRYCVKAERTTPAPATAAVRAMLPRVLDRHGLVGKAPGARPADDAWIERTSRAIFSGTPEEAADVAAAAIAEGRSQDAISDAIALAATELLLRDAGRGEGDARPDKPVGSVHGDSVGVHACDSAHAWTNLARLGDARTATTCLVLGAWQVARDRIARGGDFLRRVPHPLPDALARVTATDSDALEARFDAAVRERDQALAAAVVARRLEAGHPPRAIVDACLRFAISEDGALHAEKYWRTATAEFAAARPAFRNRHLVALARVTASEFGRPAPGVAEARRLLGA